MKGEVRKIADLFRKELGDRLVSVTVYGSQAQETSHSQSDIDYYLVLDQINMPVLEKIKSLREEYERDFGIDLSVNIIKEKETPKHRLNSFYHKNRKALFLHEANKNDIVLIGENPFETEDLPTYEEIRIEAVQMINSFAYTARKDLVNKNLETALKDALRFSVYSTQYAHAFEGRYPLETLDAVRTFPEFFLDFEHARDILKIHKAKTHQIEGFDKKEMYDLSLRFLEGLDEYIAKRYLEEKHEVQS